MYSLLSTQGPAIDCHYCKEAISWYRSFYISDYLIPTRLILKLYSFMLYGVSSFKIKISIPMTYLQSHHTYLLLGIKETALRSKAVSRTKEHSCRQTKLCHSLYNIQLPLTCPCSIINKKHDENSLMRVVWKAHLYMRQPGRVGAQDVVPTPIFQDL